MYSVVIPVLRHIVNGNYLMLLKKCGATYSDLLCSGTNEYIRETNTISFLGILDNKIWLYNIQLQFCSHVVKVSLSSRAKFPRVSYHVLHQSFMSLRVKFLSFMHGIKVSFLQMLLHELHEISHQCLLYFVVDLICSNIRTFLDSLERKFIPNVILI